MSDKSHQFWRERVALRYLDALDTCDSDTLAELWEQAAADPELVALISELNEGIFSEEVPGPSLEDDAGRVLNLARRHLPSGFPPEASAGSLTAGDVAARLLAESGPTALLDVADREVNARLLNDRTPLPEPLGLSHVERWSTRLGIVASPRYWRAFHKAAVLLKMARAEGAGRLAAARPANPKPDPGGRSS